MEANGGRREAASKMLASAGYTGAKVPTAGGKPVHMGPNAENAATAPDQMGMSGEGGEFKDGGRARTSGATAESPLTPTSSDDAGGMKRGGRARSRRGTHHRMARVQQPPPPPPDDPAMAGADAGAPPMGGGSGAMEPPPPGGPPAFKNGGRNPGQGAGGGLGRLRKAGLPLP